MRHLLIFSLLSAGCLKHAPARVAAESTPLTVITALGSYQTDAVTPLPSYAVERLARELTDRNFVLRGGGEFADDFALRRDVSGRLGALRDAKVPEPVLLVSCDPRFDVQVNGRFRWQVECAVAISPADTIDGRVEGQIRPPAHLMYYHQQEDAAVDEVAAVLAREVGRVLDQWLALQR